MPHKFGGSEYGYREDCCVIWTLLGERHRWRQTILYSLCNASEIEPEALADFLLNLGRFTYVAMSN